MKERKKDARERKIDRSGVEPFPPSPVSNLLIQESRFSFDGRNANGKEFGGAGSGAKTLVHTLSEGARFLPYFSDIGGERSYLPYS